MSSYKELQQKAKDLISQLRQHCEKHDQHASNYLALTMLTSEVDTADTDRLNEIITDVEKILFESV